MNSILFGSNKKKRNYIWLLFLFGLKMVAYWKQNKAQIHPIQSTTKNNFLSAKYYRESSMATNQSTRCHHQPNLKKKKTHNFYGNICRKKKLGKFIGSLVSVLHKRFEMERKDFFSTFRFEFEFVICTHVPTKNCFMKFYAR